MPNPKLSTYVNSTTLISNNTCLRLQSNSLIAFAISTCFALGAKMTTTFAASNRVNHNPLGDTTYVETHFKNIG